MSFNEILVIGFGFFLGYWVIAKLIGAKAPAPEQRAASSHETDAPGKAAAGALPWHEVLAVDPDSSVADIRAAYRTLISQYHPDKVASLGPELRALAERKSKEITGAYREAMQARGADV